MTTTHPRGLLTTLVVCSALALTACNPTATESEGEDAPFIVARTADIDGRDPATATAFQTVQTLDLVYDTLIETNDEGELEPGLASEWQVSGDGTTVTLTLRDDVQFHNGADLTADDVKATLDRVLDPETGSVVASNLASVKEVRAVDDTTVEIALSQPDAALLNVLAQVGTAVLDADDIEAGDVGREVNGTGAFRWELVGPGRAGDARGEPGLLGRRAAALDGRDARDPRRVLDPLRHARRQLRPRHRHRPRRGQPGRRRRRGAAVAADAELPRAAAQRAARSAGQAARTAGDRLRPRPRGGRQDGVLR